MGPSKPSKRWTVIALAAGLWNVSTKLTGLPPVTEIARKHPKTTVVVWLALGYHLKPRRVTLPDRLAG